MNRPPATTAPSGADSAVRAVMYLRVARELQPGVAAALQAQREACERKVRELGADLVEIYTDAGALGVPVQRPAFQQMTVRIRTLRDVDYVIVRDMSRIARRATEVVTVTRELRQCGARIISAEAGPGSEAENAFIQAVLRAVSDFQARETARQPSTQSTTPDGA